MVYAVCREVFRHLLETLLPPAVVVFLHYHPVIGRHTPVLSVCRESVGWCSGLSVHVEVLRLYPRFYAGATYSDRDVALYQYTFFASVVARFQQLYVQLELNEQVERYLFIVGTLLVAESLYKFGVVLAVFPPIVEI